MYHWKRSLDQGPKESGERAAETDRALGRKVLEVDVLKKAFELKGLKSPEGMYGG